MRNFLYGLIGLIPMIVATAVSAQAVPTQPPAPPGYQAAPRLDFNSSDTTERRFLDSLNDRASGNGPAAEAGRRIAAALSVPCDVTSAVTLQEGRARSSTGRQRIESYELVCSEGLGWIVTDFERQPDEAFDCVALATVAATDPGAGRCRLRLNNAPHAGLQKVAETAGVDCKVSQARYVGTGGEPAIRRYEAACDGGLGYLIDAPALGSTAPVSAMDCLEASAAEVECTLTPKDAQMAYIGTMAAASGNACQVADARSLAATATRHFYEIGCAGSPGYVIEADSKRVFVRSLTCAQVANVAGGCQLDQNRRGS